jgi:outer membrane lipoprotein SlyB
MEIKLVWCAMSRRAIALVLLAGSMLASSAAAQTQSVRTGQVEVERDVHIHYLEAGDRGSSTPEEAV